MLKYFTMNLKLKNISPKITWVGDGNYRTQCEELGFVTGMVGDVKKYLKVADFVCATSYISILDSQASCKVVCAMYQHDLKKRYLETYPGVDGVLVSGSANDLSFQVIDIISDKNEYFNTVKCATRYASKTTWSEVVDVYEKLWSKN